MSADITNIRR